jgi:hypothetical protein
VSNLSKINETDLSESEISLLGIIDLAKAKLAREPKIFLEDGLKETITYFRNTIRFN